MHFPKLHFVTQPTPTHSTTELVEKACLGGARLIQLRIKEQPLAFIIEEAKAIQQICKKYQATFILNDYVSVVKELNIDGVHLGQTDLSPVEARKLLGENTIIGGTASNLEEVTKLLAAKINYIGLGPFQFTETKKKLSPILGIEGYIELFKALENVDNVPPIFAIGGIKENDIQPLLATGVYGVAVSGLITNSTNIIEKVEQLNKLLYTNS